MGGLAEPLDMSLPAVTKHLKMLERAKLISRSKDAQWRPCRLEEAPLNAASGWIAEQRKICGVPPRRLGVISHGWSG